MQQSLYERVGGQAAIIAAVDVFYEKLLGDPSIAPFFDGVDMQTQVKKLVAFMAFAFDGPAEYKGRNLREAHARLVEEKGLNDEHFDQVAKHLQETLLELGLPSDVVTEAMTRVAALRDEVLGR